MSNIRTYDIESRLINIMKNNGVEFYDNSLNEKLTMDSIEFVSMIVEIENEFNIEVPDEYLLIEKLNTFTQICDMIESNMKA